MRRRRPSRANGTPRLPDDSSQPDADQIRRARRVRVVWIAWWIVLFVLTHWPKPPQVPTFRQSDKFVHFGAYFALAMLGGRVWIGLGRHISGRSILTWWAIYAAYAAFDELTQPIVGRACDFYDWLADVIGATVALIIVWAYRPTANESA